MIKTNNVEYFYIETRPNISVEKLSKFFTSKNVNVREFSVDSKSDKLISYKVSYLYNPESIIILELLKKQKTYEVVKDRKFNC